MNVHTLTKKRARCPTTNARETASPPRLSALLQSHLHELAAQLGEFDARMASAVGQEARLGHAGNGVRLEDIRRPICGDDEVGA